ncbi:LLM class flavin-dependent oxidoreductase [Flavisphingomonas formosensis]|uniref:LLM class flavin-dependent oxidoreductase n=1 Tax=Flavisphingomonas formosensis TaxID=861534 RepID=UPI0012FA336B|nr:LLM class flavin-dependent oxidoreductase [Sphingomonas formosensis]
MTGENAFKLGLFGANADGGLAATTVPERWAARWPDIAEVARIADEAGLDFFLPIARWKGFGGTTNARGHSFETLTLAAALAAVTRRMAIFATVHAPFVHPVFAAKALATIDHVANGRSGLNIVCGWNEPEFALFGIPPVEQPYSLGREWYDVLAGILTGQGTFDHDGSHFRLRDVEGRPLALQRPRPLVMSAAFSPAGRDFAARTSDILLTTFVELDDARRTIADVTARAQAVGRSLDVYTACHVVCRQSQAEAEDYYDRFAVREVDKEAVERHMAMKRATSGSHDPAAYRLHAKRFAAGAGTYPLVGTPATIAGRIVAMRQAGFAGTALSFVDYLGELPFFVDEVLPLLREAGVRP